MDRTDFDHLAQVVSRNATRRGALAAVLAASLGLVGQAETDARKKRKKKHTKATCRDGKRNGGESDVDCGGSCPRCATGLRCVSRDDCASALCRDGRCQAPTADAECGGDFRGGCYVGEPVTGGTAVCTTGDATGPVVSTCAACPAGTLCFDYAPGAFWCFKLCDAL